MENPSVPTLYHTKWFPSSIPLNVLHELNVPEEKFVVKTITEDEAKNGDEFVKASPRRMNPAVLFPDGTNMLETGAITMHLLERFDNDGKLHPLSWDENRPKFLQGMFYAVTDANQKTFEMFRLTKQEKQRDEEKIAAVMKDIQSIVFDHLEKELYCGEKDYYLGEEYSAVDIMFAYILMCLEYCEVKFGKVINEYFERLKAKDGYKFTYSFTEEDAKLEEERKKVLEREGGGGRSYSTAKA